MLYAQEIDLVEKIYLTNKAKIVEVSDITDIEKNIFQRLDDSILLHAYHEIYFYKVFKITACKEFANLIIIKASYNLQNGKHNIGNSELQLIGIKSLSNKYGNILLRPETMEDKLVEFFNRTEIDFKDYPLFSSKYYLLADNENLCHSFFTNHRISLIQNQNEILVQVTDNLLIAKYCRLLTHNDFENMIDFIHRI